MKSDSDEQNGFGNNRNSESATSPRKSCLFATSWSHYCLLVVLASLRMVLKVLAFIIHRSFFWRRHSRWSSSSGANFSTSISRQITLSSFLQIHNVSLSNLSHNCAFVYSFPRSLRFLCAPRALRHLYLAHTPCQLSACHVPCYLLFFLPDAQLLGALINAWPCSLFFRDLFWSFTFLFRFHRFPTLASEAQEAQAVFSCREALSLFSPAFLICFFFCCSSSRPVFACNSARHVLDFCLSLPSLSPSYFDELSRSQSTKNNWLTTGPQIRMETSPSRQVRCELLLFPFYSGRGFIFDLPHPCVIPNNWLYLLCCFWIVGAPEDNVSHC